MYGPGLQAAIYDSLIRAGEPSSPKWGLSGFYASVVQPGYTSDPATRSFSSPNMERLRQLAYHDRARASREMGELSRELAASHRQPPGSAVKRLGRPRTGPAILRAPARASAQLVPTPDALHRGPALPDRRIHLQPFLSEEILRHPEWADQLLESGNLQRVLTAEQMREMLEAALPPGLPAPLEFARFRRRQLLRILIRDVLGLGTLPEITGELTALADTIVETAYDRIRQQLVAEYGVPQTRTGEESHFAVIALGKMGGNELNYSSDIDLMFLYQANGETSGGRAGKSPTANSSYAPRINLPLCFRPIPPKACAIAWTCVCAPTAAKARCVSRSKPRANTTPTAPATGNCR